LAEETVVLLGSFRLPVTMQWLTMRLQQLVREEGDGEIVLFGVLRNCMV